MSIGTKNSQIRDLDLYYLLLLDRYYLIREYNNTKIWKEIEKTVEGRGGLEMVKMQVVLSHLLDHWFESALWVKGRPGKFQV
jgi:hypothetical protein